MFKSVKTYSMNATHKIFTESIHCEVMKIYVFFLLMLQIALLTAAFLSNEKLNQN